LFGFLEESPSIHTNSRLPVSFVTGPLPPFLIKKIIFGYSNGNLFKILFFRTYVIL